MMHKLVVLCLVIAAFFGGYFYMNRIAPTRLAATNFEYRSTNVPTAFDQFKIGFLSDSEILNKDDLAQFDQAIQILNKEDVDLVILGGDLFKQNANYDEKEFISLLKSVRAPYGKFAILGENEANGNIDFVVSLIKKGGFELLRNQAHPIYYNDSSIVLAGMENSGDVDSILTDDQKKAFVLAAIHQPDYFSKAKNSSMDLQLSGHSHGGYIYIPFYGGLIHQEGAKTYQANHYHEKGKDLYISHGIGMEEGQHLRLNTRPGPMIVTLNHQKEVTNEKTN